MGAAPAPANPGGAPRDGELAQLADLQPASRRKRARASPPMARRRPTAARRRRRRRADHRPAGRGETPARAQLAGAARPRRSRTRAVAGRCGFVVRVPRHGSPATPRRPARGERAAVASGTTLFFREMKSTPADTRLRDVARAEGGGAARKRGAPPPATRCLRGAAAGRPAVAARAIVSLAASRAATNLDVSLAEVAKASASGAAAPRARRLGGTPPPGRARG